MSAGSEAPLRRALVLVLDSVGIGGAPDAAEFGDEGSATLQHVAEAVGGLEVPSLAALGLGNIAEVEGVPPADRPRASYGAMTERSPGKDTTTGHWEMAGVILDKPFPTYPDGFPDEVIERFESVAGVEAMGNEVASGTEIIARLGDEHRRSGRPIVYTSADSVFQVAAHVDVIPLDRLHEMCKQARERVLVGEHEVGRVIARPFTGTGTPDDPYARTPDRHDYAVPPPSDTLLDLISGAGLEVHAIGKISDIYAGRGVTSAVSTKSNADGLDRIIEAIESVGKGLIFANLVDFDQAYGHRNDPNGYARALEEVDDRLPQILDALGTEDALFITADHGNDPTTPSTDHSRERVPLLVVGEGVAARDLGVRDCFADLGATVVDLLGVPGRLPGQSFSSLLLA